MNKKMRMRGLLLAALLAIGQVVSLTTYSDAVYADSMGLGTSENPYQISTCEQLQAMNDDLDASYILVHDIDCSGTVHWNYGAGFDPIAGSAEFLNRAFQGTFDGDGHSINGLYINRPDYFATGLFATVAGANISHVTVNGTVVGGDFTGGLVGFAYIAAAIKDVRSNMQVTGISSNFFDGPFPMTGVGGLVGVSIGASEEGVEMHGVTIEKVVSTGTITAMLGDEAGYNIAGGLVGMLFEESELKDSYTSADVVSGAEGEVMVAGAVGAMLQVGISGGTPTINNVYSLGTIHLANGNSGGGFVGATQGAAIKHSFTVSRIDASEGDSYHIGNFLGSQDPETVLTDNFLDVGRTDAITCVGGTGEGGDAPGCTGVNYGVPEEETYFFSNNTNPPLNAWDFVCTWQIQTDDYPILRSPSPGCDTVPDNSGGGDVNGGHGADGGGHVSIPLVTLDKPIDLYMKNTQTRTHDIAVKYSLDAFDDYTGGHGQRMNNLKVGQVLTFDIVHEGKTEHHTVTIKEIGSDYVIITVASTPFDVKIMLHDTQAIALDGKDIMTIRLASLSDSGASLVFSKIQPVVKTVAVTPKTSREINTKQDQAVGSWVFWIALGVVGIASSLLIGLVKLRKVGRR